MTCWTSPAAVTATPRHDLAAGPTAPVRPGAAVPLPWPASPAPAPGAPGAAGPGAAPCPPELHPGTASAAIMTSAEGAAAQPVRRSGPVTGRALGARRGRAAG